MAHQGVAEWLGVQWHRRLLTSTLNFDWTSLWYYRPHNLWTLIEQVCETTGYFGRLYAAVLHQINPRTFYDLLDSFFKVKS